MDEESKEMDEDLKKAAEELLNNMPEEARKELKKIADESVDGDDFISALFVGNCPKCNSTQTRDCESVEGIEDPTAGLCMHCGYIWCTECSRSIQKNLECGHWKVCEECDAEKDEFDFCGIAPWECDKLTDK